MLITRRGFLKALVIGAAVAAAPAIIVPERRIWQVSRKAPVGWLRRIGSTDLTFDSGDAFNEELHQQWISLQWDEDRKDIAQGQDDDLADAVMYTVKDLHTRDLIDRFPPDFVPSRAVLLTSILGSQRGNG